MGRGELGQLQLVGRNNRDDGGDGVPLRRRQRDRYDGASGALLRRFVPGAAVDEDIAMVTAAGVKSFFHPDKTSSTVAMSTAAGGLAEGPYTYDAYGVSASTSGVPFRYTGQYYDGETGLYYYRAR